MTAILEAGMGAVAQVSNRIPFARMRVEYTLRRPEIMWAKHLFSVPALTAAVFMEHVQLVMAFI